MISDKSADGGPAFPSAERNGNGSHHYSHLGLSLRDACALAALPAALQQAFSMTSLPRRDIPRFAAECSYEIADAMLKARGQ